MDLLLPNLVTAADGRYSAIYGGHNRAASVMSITIDIPLAQTYLLLEQKEGPTTLFTGYILVVALHVQGRR